MIGCDVLFRVYDVKQKVGVMSFKSGCDISGDVVMTKIQWVQCLIQGLCCPSWSGCDIINTLVWCDRVVVLSFAVQSMSYICRVLHHQQWGLWCHIVSGYYVINIADMMSHIYWIWGHTYSGCDIIDRVGVMTEMQWHWGQTEWTWYHT